jgi:hypothetical protein
MTGDAIGVYVCVCVCVCACVLQSVGHSVFASFSLCIYLVIIQYSLSLLTHPYSLSNPLLSLSLSLCRSVCIHVCTDVSMVMDSILIFASLDTCKNGYLTLHELKNAINSKMSSVGYIGKPRDGVFFSCVCLCLLFYLSLSIRYLSSVCLSIHTHALLWVSECVCVCRRLKSSLPSWTRTRTAE